MITRLFVRGRLCYMCDMQDDVFKEIVRLREERVPAALATIIRTLGSTPGKIGQKMVVRRDASILGTIGGGCVEADVIRGALDVMDTNQTKLMQFTLSGEEAERTGLACGGKVEIMIESLNEHNLLILGCGHIGQRVAALAHSCGFQVTAMDDRPEFASTGLFPDGVEVICTAFADFNETLQVGPATSILCATRGHKYDYEGLRWALTTEADFIGVVGSRSKRKQFFDQLKEEEYATDETLSSVQIPVGIDIGAETPDEIAVSIVAALVAKRAKKL